MSKTKAKAKTAEEFDRRFDAGEDAMELADFEPVSKDSTRISLDLPPPFVSQLDRAAGVRGVTRQSLIKMWLYDLIRKEMLEEESRSPLARLREASAGLPERAGRPKPKALK
jgi:hypothetical protein